MSSTQQSVSRATLLPAIEERGYLFEDGILGVNLEITRTGFFGGLCAEMLNNRKLFMGKDGVDGWICEGFERVLDRPEESLCQSNFIVLKDGSMSQTSRFIALQEGKDYEARVWVKAYSSTARVTFGVEGLEQTQTVLADGAPYRCLSFIFAGKELANGTFLVKVSGEVAVYEVSCMPTEHFHGMRWDVIEHLRRIAPTALRFPGGCAADHFAWRESLKAPEFRRPVDGLDMAGHLFRDTYHQDTMDIGLNEFMLLCRELDAEPEFTVSLVQSDGQDARDLVEYCNGDAATEYGAKRQALGLDPFGIHLWYVGNEAYFFGHKYKNSVLAANRTDELTAAMKQADPTIAVAIGLTWGTGYQKWAFEFMENLKSPFEYVSYHDYIGILPDATQGANGMATCEILESNFADGECFGLNFYRNQLYADNFADIRICVDEWNYSWGKPSSNALFFSNALQFHFLAKSKESYHVDRAEFFMPVNEGMITVQGPTSRIESTGEMFRLLAGHRGGRVIPCASDTPALDVLCTDHGDRLYVSVVNRGADTIPLCVKGCTVAACTEIETHEYSFESNGFDVCERTDPVVHGHSMSFLTLQKQVWPACNHQNCKGIICMDIRHHTVPDYWGRDTEDMIVPKIQAVLDNIKRKGIVYINRRECVTGYAIQELYDWDLYFETLFLSHFGVAKYCRNNVETFLDIQEVDGYVSRAVVNRRPTQHFKPFLAQTALLGSRQLQDFRWLAGERYYPRLKRYLERWFAYDSDGNGLCYWNGSDHSGMDNQARRLGYMDVNEYEGVDLNCYLVRELEAMAEIATAIGKEDEAAAFRSHAEALKVKINETFWDEEDGFYYDRSEKTGELNKVKSVAGFIPLWVGVATPEHAERLVKEHLLNPEEFWTKYPVATWSKSEPDYHQEKRGNESTWMGSTWIPTNYMVFRGLIRYGYTEIAQELADKTFELVVSEVDLREYYNGETGAGQGLSPFWGWSSLGYLMKAELECGFCHSDLDNESFVTLDGFTF